MAAKPTKKAVKEAIKRLEARGIDSTPRGYGSVIGGDEELFRYYIIPKRHPGGAPKADYEVGTIREVLRGLEYEPAPDDVKVAGMPIAEVWQTPREVWLWRKREEKRQWARDPVWSVLQESRQRAGVGYVPTADELAEPEDSPILGSSVE